MAEEGEPQTVNTATSSSTITEDHVKQSQAPGLSAFPATYNGDIQMLPIMYPVFVPGLIPPQNQEGTNRGAGIYAVPVLPFMGTTAVLPSGTLIPLTYSIPTRIHQAEGGATSGELAPEGRQPHAPQRQVVVRRFHFAFHLDLLLILKLAAVIFVFNQDGSRQRLFLLVLFAIIVYLYQTGALTPLIRWLSQGMHRAGAPPEPRPAVRAENAPAAAGPDNDDAARADGLPGGENVNQGGENENQPENQNQAGISWWRIVKEVQMIVVGFITSLLPGFHNLD